MAKMQREQAEKIMGLSGKYDSSVLRNRRRELVKKYHPDLAQQNGLTKEEAEAKTIELQAAYSTLDNLLRLRGELTAIGTQPAAGFDMQNESRPYDSTSEVGSVPETRSGDGDDDTRFSTQTTWSQMYNTYRPEPASSQSTQARTTTAQTSQVASEPYREPLLRRVIEHFPYRIGFIVLTLLITYLLTGSDIVSLSYSIGDTNPELFFLLLGMTLAAFLNLFIGTVTIAAKQACLWFYDKFIAKTEFPESIRHAIFGHLPYRIMFMAFAIWWYWDFATFHVAESGPFDWPLRVIVFLAAGINFVIPFATSPIRAILAGDNY